MSAQKGEPTKDVDGFDDIPLLVEGGRSEIGEQVNNITWTRSAHISWVALE